jgi:hypothetical protein
VTELPMFSHEGHFYNSYHRERTQKNNAVFPVTKPTKTQGQPNCFMHDMGPIFKLYRLLGNLPLHMDDSGNSIYNQKNKRIINNMEQSHS